jgi:hypothetical protein
MASRMVWIECQLSLRLCQYDLSYDVHLVANLIPLDSLLYLHYSMGSSFRVTAASRYQRLPKERRSS